MKVTPVRGPLDNEQIVAVDPPLIPRVDAGWRRRLHLFTGRSLDATALAAGQSARAARTALLGQALSPGIVAGLEASLEGADYAGAVLDVAPGLGITAYGEDVRLPRALRVPLGEVQTIAPDGGGAGTTLREIVDSGFLPPVLVLILQPVLVEEIGGADPLDPCERDPQSEAFEDQRTVDACRPLLVSWPEDWPLPAPGLRWRNQLAWAIFERARLRPLPWEELGLPLGLIGNDLEARTLFLDRSAVARIGGRPRPRTPLLPQAGDPGLWQARIQQCAEQLAELFADPATTVAQAATRFERLPPAGLLPREVLVLASDGSSVESVVSGETFFPAGFHVGAAPVPLDELEPVFDASASLSPLDVARPEEVQLLVPVPGFLYDPDLLIRERVDPEFEATLAEFRLDRNRWLGRRADVREKYKTLLKSLEGGGAKLPYPDVDPDAQSDEAPVLPPEPAESDFGTFPEPSDTKVRVLRDLKTMFQRGPYQLLRAEWDRERLEQEGLDGLIRVLALKVAKANDKIDLGFLSLQTEIYRIRQIALGNVTGTRLATSPVLAEIAQGESAKVTRESLAKVFQSRSQESFAFAAGTEAAPEVKIASEFTALSGLDSGTFSLVSPTFLGTVAEETVATPTLAATLGRTGAFQLDAKIVADDIRKASALPGLAIDRTLSVTQRLSIPPAQQAQDFAMSNLLQILTGLDEIGIEVDDLRIPLYRTQDTARVRDDQTYSQIKGDLANKILQQPKVVDADEANILGDAVAFQENSSIFLRRLEGRVQLYQNALDKCRLVAAEIRTLLAAARQRLAAVDRELAEARHDVTVGLALLEEETKRIEEINNRRLDILTNHVPFLAYHRPRVAETLAGTPVRSLDPGLFEDPVPAALARAVDPPAELREMVELLRDAPLRWFRRLPALLDKLDRLDVLRDTLRLAKGRAEAALARPPVQIATLTLTSPAAQGASKTLVAQRQKVVQHKTEMARLDLAAVERQSWKGAADLAKRVLSLGDLLDVPHGRAEVARLGARELDEILRVATALWAEFGELLPALRLDWVERLSQYDAPFDLRRLSNLPRWEEIEILDRKTLQSLADWLFQRIDPKEPEAVELINDLVRVSLLLASHAPVDRIVAGHVAEDTPIKPGGTVPLVVDLTKVRIGMQVVLFSQERTVARGIVEDLGDGRATARVLQAYASQVSVTKNARVEFTEVLPGKTLK